MIRASQTWQPDVRAVMDASPFLGRSEVDMTDPEFIAAARARGPVPESVDGVEITETTVPVPDGHEITVRVYRPTTPAPGRPAYVLLHGGGWSCGSLETEHPRCLELTRRCGAVGVSVDFRMAPDVPAETLLAHCWAAVAWTAPPATTPTSRWSCTCCRASPTPSTASPPGRPRPGPPTT